MQSFRQLSTGLLDFWSLLAFSVALEPRSTCQGPIERQWTFCGVKATGRMDEPVLFFSIHVQPDFLFPIWDRDVAFRSRDNDCLAG